MKKILTVFAALAMVAGLASSCQKEGAFTDNPAQGKLVNVKLTAAFEGDSKVTYSETDNILTPAWEMDDAILVINPSVDPSTLTVTSIDGDGYATLEGTAEPGLVHLVYKKGITTGDWQDNKIEIGYDGQSINDDMPAVMFADGQVSSNGSGSFQFRNAGAVIGIYNAKGVPAESAISKVTLSGSNLSAATVSINGNALVLTATEKDKDAISTETLSDIIVATGETGALSEEILIAVPAGAKVEKVTLTVGEDTYSYTLAAAKTCNANDYLYVKTQQFKKDVVTTGTAKRTGDIDVNWVQLWAGGPKFAEYNVGVTDGNAESYGGYYTWGGTYENGTGNPWNDDHNTGFSELSHTGDDITDTATNLWGGNWRMPTKAEFENLLSNCNVVWTTVGGVYGRKFTGKGAYTSNSVFLPAAGYCDVGSVYDQGYYGCGEYWSSTPGDGDDAYYLSFHSGNQYVINDGRGYGLSIRAVLAEED